MKKEKGINVLSLFDGISGGQQALQRAGIKVNKYFAAEIDKHAMKVTQDNFPKTTQLGSVLDVTAEKLPKIDLLIGGSPCQGFSMAGKRLNFDDPRSMLFWEYVRLLKELKPTYFLLENVKMEEWCLDVISNALGVQPVLIDSATVCAQHRERYYWTNIPGRIVPKTKNIILADILEDIEIDDDRQYQPMRGRSFERFQDFRYCRMMYVGDVVGRGSKPQNVLGSFGKSTVPEDWKQPYQMRTFVYSAQGKSPTLLAGMGPNENGIKVALSPTHFRWLTVTECERLQTVEDGFTKAITPNQRIRALGNGWTIDVIAQFFGSMKLVLETGEQKGKRHGFR